MITLRYFAAAAERVGVAVESVDVSGSVADLRVFLAARHPTLAPVLRQSRLAINQRFVNDDAVVVDGVEVAVIPPVGGG